MRCDSPPSRVDYMSHCIAATDKILESIEVGWEIMSKSYAEEAAWCAFRAFPELRGDEANTKRY